MRKSLASLLMFLGVSGTMMAGFNPAPEIDASAGAAALALVSGGLVILRSRRTKK